MVAAADRGQRDGFLQLLAGGVAVVLPRQKQAKREPGLELFGVGGDGLAVGRLGVGGVVECVLRKAQVIERARVFRVLGDKLRQCFLRPGVVLLCQQVFCRSELRGICGCRLRGLLRGCVVRSAGSGGKIVLG